MKHRADKCRSNRIAYSNMDTEATSGWLASNYGLAENAKVDLLRAYTNDVYLVTFSREKYILKIYGKDWRNAEEVGYEVQLQRYLASQGLLIANVVVGVNGEAVKTIRTPLGEQSAVLYGYALGEKPQPPFTNELYFLFGEAIGRMHLLSSHFSCEYNRRPLDSTYLVSEPLALIKSHLPNTSGDFELLLKYADMLKSKVNELNAKGLDWGPIHGDATLDNLHITSDNRVILYDFDSGGPGWRASDLQGWAVGNLERRDHYNSFLRGYRNARELSELDIEASPYLSIAWDIWGMKVDLENRVVKFGQDRVNKYLGQQIASINERFLSLHLG